MPEALLLASELNSERRDILSWQFGLEGAIQVGLILNAQFLAALFVDSLLPAHVLFVENKWLRCHNYFFLLILRLSYLKVEKFIFYIFGLFLRV